MTKKNIYKQSRINRIYSTDEELWEFFQLMDRQLEESNIYLIGMMGSGKTTVGKLLAEKLNYVFVDTDNLIIEESAEKTIKEIFENQGEEKFRELESQTLEKVSEKSQKSVIATGGGIVTKDENWECLSKGLSIWLDVDLNLLNQRLARDEQTHRPLINQLESLLKTRRSSYKKANLRIPIKSEQTPEALVTEITNLIDCKTCLSKAEEAKPITF